MEPASATILTNLSALQAEAARFAAALVPSREHATLVTLSGELGAGKTSFTQGIAKTLGVEEPITSPTFVLEKKYVLSESEFTQLVHIDAYRLEGESSLAPLRFNELYADPNVLIVLEWPELVGSQLPGVDHAVTLRVEGEGRTISYA